MTKNDIQNLVEEYLQGMIDKKISSWRIQKAREILVGFYNDKVDGFHEKDLTSNET